jgi:hypothetical protein
MLAEMRCAIFRTSLRYCEGRAGSKSGQKQEHEVRKTLEENGWEKGGQGESGWAHVFIPTPA